MRSSRSRYALATRVPVLRWNVTPVTTVRALVRILFTVLGSSDFPVRVFLLLSSPSQSLICPAFKSTSGTLARSDEKHEHQDVSISARASALRCSCLIAAPSTVGPDRRMIASSRRMHVSCPRPTLCTTTRRPRSLIVNAPIYNEVPGQGAFFIPYRNPRGAAEVDHAYGNEGDKGGLSSLNGLLL
jgi:hypothetical protein